MGLALGSFATALVYRVPRNIPWGTAARSSCPHCNTALKARDLVPLFSWAAVGGQCRYCKADIGYIYPLVELGVLLGCLGVYWALGLTPESVTVIFCVPFLAALLVIDLQYLILPHQLILIAGGLGLAQLAVAFPDGVQDKLAGMAVYGLAAWLLGFGMTRFLKKDALGFGDVKFFAMAGLWLGLAQLGWFCLLSGIFGIILALAWRLAGKGEVFPFGPALIVSLYVLLIFDGSLFP